MDRREKIRIPEICPAKVSSNSSYEPKGAVLKPERIQSKVGSNELQERIEMLLHNHPEWVLRSDEAVLVRRWQMPDRRTATSLVTWLSHLAEAIGAEPELTLRQSRVILRLSVSGKGSGKGGGVSGKNLDLITAIEGTAA